MTISDLNTKILIVIPKALKEKLEEKARKDNRSISNYIVRLIQKDIESQ